MIATAPAVSRDGSFDDVVSVAFCGDADSGDCIDGMFAQQGIDAMSVAVVVCCVMQHTAAQPGTMAATRTTAATVAAAQRCSTLIGLRPREITESSNLRPTIGISQARLGEDDHLGIRESGVLAEIDRTGAGLIVIRS